MEVRVEMYECELAHVAFFFFFFFLGSIFPKIPQFSQGVCGNSGGLLARELEDFWTCFSPRILGILFAG